MAVPGYVLKCKRTTLERAEKFISATYFTDVNLYGRLYPKKAEVRLFHYAAPDRIPYAEAVKATFTPTKVGTAFGPVWSTHWFRVEVEIPAEWKGEEVRFRWNSHSEAMIWMDGRPIQGLTDENRRTDFVLSKCLQDGQCKQMFYVEMACNGCFGAGGDLLISPPDQNAKFNLDYAEIAVIDKHVYDLLLDLEILIGLVKHLPENSNRGYQALYTANEIVNMCDFSCPESLVRAHQVATTFFEQKNGETQHTTIAVGNCHIDTAWLWPYAETRRKCGRSWSSTLRLMKEYPNLTFACSQAQQFDWVKEDYPELYADIKAAVRGGRFIPVGGTWVEMDGNVPSGEGFIRQFFYGQKFFKTEFGSTCSEFWLPDTFGYSAQLPQIMKLAGIDRFLTQKMSWNLVNKFPHNTFFWEGLDGSRVLAHFPPGDNYCMKGKVEEVVKTLNNFKDKGRSNLSVYLYGYGDGGQGPTAEIIEKLQRMKDIDGLPKVEFGTPEEFFGQVEAHDAHKLCVWTGELYLELHNGTYTTQAKTKRYNRKCEFLLRDVEAVSTMAHVVQGATYQADEIERIWKLVLLNQFHDVLPGTSINLVYKDVMKFYKDVEKTGKKILDEAVTNLFEVKGAESVSTPIAFNTLNWARSEVVTLTTSDTQSPASKKKKKTEPITQVDMYGGTLVLTEVPGFGFDTVAGVAEIKTPALATKGEGNLEGHVILSNEYLEAVLDPLGRIVSLKAAGSNRNAIKPEEYGNQFVVFDDVPLYWDAWDVMDYHLETRSTVHEIVQMAMIVESGPLRATAEVSLKISDRSYLKQYITLDARCPYLKLQTEVEWHENHKFLKVEFPFDIHAQQATFEVPCGHLKRNTHLNTSWDSAQIEVCGHKWADVSEYGFGVAVLNDCKYGWNCIGSNLYLSLLRSAKSPDEKADMGSHSFTYAIMPHTGTFQEAGVVHAAYELNNPVITQVVNKSSSIQDTLSFISFDSDAIILEAVKKADFKNGIVLRLYESFGGHSDVTVKVNVPFKQAVLCNILEEDMEDQSALVRGEDGVMLTLSFKPFEIVTLLLQQ